MKRFAGILTFTSFLLLALTAGNWSIQRRPRPSQVPVSVASGPAISAAAESVAPPAAFIWLRGVVEPVLALRVMQRTVAAKDLDAAGENPLGALLAADLSLTELGPIKVGMSVEEAAAAGISLIALTDQSRGNCQYYRAKSNPEPIGFMAVDGQIIRIDILPGSLTQTLSGVGIGSSEQAVYAAYPEQIEVSPNPLTGGHSLTFIPGDRARLHRIVFETNAEGKVVQYRAGQFPAVTWPNGCL